MVGKYPILLGADQVGEVSVEKQGLYYQFSCRCGLRDGTMQHVVMNWDNNREDLGLCMPMDEGFGLVRKLPCKRFRGSAPEFRLVPRNYRGCRKFIPVYPEEPFSYMDKLKDAYLEIRCGQAGISLTE